MNTGTLMIFFGPMGSGKSTRALEEASTYAALGMRTTYITHSKDKERCEVNYYTHSGLKRKHSGVDFQHLSAIELDSLVSYEVVIVDEAQFFKDLTPLLGLVKLGKIVQAYGLISDSNMGRFGNLVDLIIKADHVEHMKAKCTVCARERNQGIIVHSNAPFTYRKVSSDEQELIGGMDLYEPRCRQHM